MTPLRPRGWLRWPWLRHPGLLLTAALALLATACAPVAGELARAIDNRDGATLTFVHQGLAFDPGPAPALGVIVRAEGDQLQLLAVPDGATCTVTTTQFDCRLGTVTTTTTIGLTGRAVVANATWRRNGATTVHITFAHALGAP